MPGSRRYGNLDASSRASSLRSALPCVHTRNASQAGCGPQTRREEGATFGRAPPKLRTASTSSEARRRRDLTLRCLGFRRRRLGRPGDAARDLGGARVGGGVLFRPDKGGSRGTRRRRGCGGWRRRTARGGCGSRPTCAARGRRGAARRDGVRPQGHVGGRLPARADHRDRRQRRRRRRLRVGRGRCCCAAAVLPPPRCRTSSSSSSGMG